MKRFYTLLIAMAIVLPATFAQKGLNIGVNGGAMVPFIINQNSWGNGHEYDTEATFNYSFGFDLGYNFTDNFGIYTGFGRMDFGQNYSDSYAEEAGGTSSDWERSIKLKYNTIPIMLKYTGSQQAVNFVGGIGIIYAMLSEAEQTWTKDGNDWTMDTETHNNIGAKDVTDRFVKSDIMINLELGARIILMENLYLDATINAGYGFTDINAEDWQTPDSKGVYSASNNVYGGFKIGIAYVLFGE